MNIFKNKKKRIMPTKIEIKSILGDVIFTWVKEGNTIKETVIEFLKSKSGALIDGVDLSNLDLSGIRFDNSSFDNSSFDNSSFDNSSFDNSRFYNSRFYNSSFDNSSFYNSRFYNSSFYNSRFYNSSFYNSRFDSATVKKIKEANQLFLLESYKADLFYKCLIRKNEVSGLRDALINGKISGTAYEGECCCFVGTIAKLAGCNYKNIEGIIPDANSPVEKWFWGISSGDTPETNELSKLAVQWIDEFLKLIK